MENNKFSGVLRKSGGSFIITIPKKITEDFCLKIGDEIVLKFIENIEQKIVEFRCKKCDYNFEQNEEILLCPKCESFEIEKKEKERSIRDEEIDKILSNFENIIIKLRNSKK